MNYMIKDSHTDEEIKDIFALKKIAVIGMSRHPVKAAHLSQNIYLNKDSILRQLTLQLMKY